MFVTDEELKVFEVVGTLDRTLMVRPKRLPCDEYCVETPVLDVVILKDEFLIGTGKICERHFREFSNCLLPGYKWEIIEK